MTSTTSRHDSVDADAARRTAASGQVGLDADAKGAIAAFLGRFGIPILLLLLVTFFSVMRPDSFATLDNYRGILDNQTIVVLLAFGGMMPLIVGQFDLSVAAVLTMCNVFAVGFAGKDGLSPGLAIALTLLIAAAFGLVNGVIIVRLQVDAFIATLATGTIAGGIVLWYTSGRTLFDPVPKSFTDVARACPWGVPLPVIYMLVIATVLWFVLNCLPVGRRMYATGGNPRAAQLAGINVRRYTIAAFVASATLSGIAGVVLGSRLGSASPGNGFSLLLPAFAGIFLGATTVRPGRFNIVGTVIAVYTLAITVSGLQHMGAPVWVEPVFNGTALIVAVALSGWAVRLRGRRAKARRLKMLSEQDAGATA